MFAHLVLLKCIAWNVLSQKKRYAEPNADLMLAHRLRLWPNIKSPLVQRLVFAGMSVIRSVRKRCADAGLILGQCTDGGTHWIPHGLSSFSTGTDFRRLNVTSIGVASSHTLSYQWVSQSEIETLVTRVKSSQWKSKICIMAVDP